jgi:hypothetical protein
MRSVPAAIVWLFALAAADALAAGTFRTVAVIGDEAPGLPDGQVFSLFVHGPTIDGQGGAAFFAASYSPAGPAYQGVWQDGAGSLQPVVLTGEQAPGAEAGVTVQSVSNVVVTNPAGDVAVSAGFSNDAFAYIIQSGGGLRGVGETGTPAPGLGDVEFGFFSPTNVQLNAAAQMTFSIDLVGDAVTAGNDEAIWTESQGGGLRLVARKGGTLPGLGLSETLGPLSTTAAPALDNDGRTAFMALILPQAPGPSGTGLWIDEPQSGPRLVARTGNSIGSHETDFIDSLRINNQGQAAFGARDVVSPGGATVDGIFVEQAAESFRTVAIEGDPLPSIGPGISIGSLNTFSYDFNDLGQVAFVASIAGPGVGSFDNDVLWLSDPVAGREPVLREGMTAPTPAGEAQTYFAFPQAFQANGAGAVAFMTNLLEEGQIQSSRQSIWVRSPDGELERVIADGDELAVWVGEAFETREVVSLRLGSTTKNIPQPRFFNDAGQVAFLATFDDGSTGLFVYTPMLTGDYNQDGSVDAADYVLWRKNDGSQFGYNAWRTNFDAGGGGTASLSNLVPEPASALLLTLWAAASVGSGRRTRCQPIISGMPAARG